MSILKPGRAIHVNGTAPDGATANWDRHTFSRGTSGVIDGRTFTPRAYRVWRIAITNTGANDLEVSFDNGANFITLGPGEAYGDDHDLKHFDVRGNGGTTTFTAVGTAYG